MKGEGITIKYKITEMSAKANFGTVYEGKENHFCCVDYSISGINGRNLDLIGDNFMHKISFSHRKGMGSSSDHCGSAIIYMPCYNGSYRQGYPLLGTLLAALQAARDNGVKVIDLNKKRTITINGCEYNGQE